MFIFYDFPSFQSSGSGSTTSVAGMELPAGMSVSASSNPMVFVDVQPDAININSVSAHVVTADQLAGARQDQPAAEAAAPQPTQAAAQPMEQG